MAYEIQPSVCSVIWKVRCEVKLYHYAEILSCVEEKKNIWISEIFYEITIVCALFFGWCIFRNAMQTSSTRNSNTSIKIWILLYTELLSASLVWAQRIFVDGYWSSTHGIPFTWADIVVEAHWCVPKIRFLYFHNRPRLDIVKHIVILKNTKVLSRLSTFRKWAERRNRGAVLQKSWK